MNDTREQPYLRCVPSESLAEEALETVIESLEDVANVGAASETCQVVMSDGDRWPSALVQFGSAEDTEKFVTVSATGAPLVVSDEDPMRKSVRLVVVVVGSPEEALALAPPSAARDAAPAGVPRVPQTLLVQRGYTATTWAWATNSRIYGLSNYGQRRIRRLRRL